LTDYTNIATINTDAENPVTTGMATALKNNPVAISEGKGPSVSPGNFPVYRMGWSGENATAGMWAFSSSSTGFVNFHTNRTTWDPCNITVWRAGTYRIRFAGYGDGGTISGNNSTLSLKRKPLGASVITVGSVAWPTTSSSGFVHYANGSNNYIDVTLTARDELYFTATVRNNGTAGLVYMSLSASSFTGPIGA